MIQITFTLADIAAAAALFAKLNGTELGHVTVSPGVSAAEKTAVLLASEAALADTVAPGKSTRADKIAAALGTTPEAIMQQNALLQDLPFKEAPGKPSVAKTARSQFTAAAGPSTPAQPAAVPATETAATQPTATVAYADLQKAVLQLHKMDSTAAVPIAQSLGADTFKLLPTEKWPEALAAVKAAIAKIATDIAAKVA